MHSIISNQPNIISINRTTECLQTHLANAINLALQCKQAHWNINGPSFMSLHELFDKAAGSASYFSDEIAERIVQLGGSPNGTVESILEDSIMSEYPVESEIDHTRILFNSWKDFSQGIAESMEDDTSCLDVVTEDILIEVLRKSEKIIWLISAHLI